MKKMNTERRALSGKEGFTLVEMILVIGLIVMLASLVIFNVDSIFGGNQEEIARHKVNVSFSTPLTTYKMHMGTYPSTEEGLIALLQAPESDRGRWKGPYITKKDDLLDPWQSELKYRYPGTRNQRGYDLYSLGPDKVESADDIGNWEIE